MIKSDRLAFIIVEGTFDEFQLRANGATVSRPCPLHFNMLVNLYALLRWYCLGAVVDNHYCGGLLCLM